MGFLDLVFPKHCVGCGQLGSYLCRRCLNQIKYLEEQTCPECYKNTISGKTHSGCQKRFGLDGVVSLISYQTPVKELIKELKYRFATDLVNELAEKLEFSRFSLPSHEWFMLPLPLHRSRQNFRGFNQAELLAKLVAEKLKLRIDNDILVRVVGTKQQVGLSKSWREQNVRSAFKLQAEPKESNYFIFDDVWTSGASLKAAAKELKKAGVKEVWGLTLAHPR